MSLDRLREAMPFHERKNKIALETQDWKNLGIGYLNLADVHTHLGALDESAQAAGQAPEFARRAEDKLDEMVSLSWQGWVASLNGNLNLANGAFEKAEPLTMDVGSRRYLWSNIGILHADHLRRTNQPDYACRVTEANLEDRKRNHVVNQLSNCNRVLGDLDTDASAHTSARTHYEAALKIARGISDRAVLIEAMLARGRWVAKMAAKDFQSFQNFGSLDQAFSDLNEALGYCVESGYRIYEADVRVALAWAWLAGDNPLTLDPSPTRGGENVAKAKAEAERALQMSEEMGYYWGVADAKEVLGEIERG
jgi:tetratricopeptide (TPR) repeat protein